MTAAPGPTKPTDAKGDATPLAFTRFGSLLASLINGTAFIALVYAVVAWFQGDAELGFMVSAIAVGAFVAGTMLGVLTEIALATAKRVNRT